MQGIVDGLLHAITQLVARIPQLLLGLEYGLSAQLSLSAFLWPPYRWPHWPLASSRMRLISSSLRPVLASMRMLCSLPVPLSFALVQDTVGINIKVTSICGFRDGRAECHQYKPTDGAVVFGHTALSLQNMYLYRGLVIGRSRKTSLFLEGMVVLLSMSLVNTPPRVSIPRLSGVTSNNSIFHFAGQHPPGWKHQWPPLRRDSRLYRASCQNSSTTCWIFGIPGRTTHQDPSSISLLLYPASFAASQGFRVRCTGLSASCSISRSSVSLPGASARHLLR